MISECQSHQKCPGWVPHSLHPLTRALASLSYIQGCISREASELRSLMQWLTYPASSSYSTPFSPSPCFSFDFCFVLRSGPHCLATQNHWDDELHLSVSVYISETLKPSPFPASPPQLAFDRLWQQPPIGTARAPGCGQTCLPDLGSCLVLLFFLISEPFKEPRIYPLGFH